VGTTIVSLSHTEDSREEVFRRILVGFDGSNDAHEALRIGIAMATTAQGEVAALIVVPPSEGETDEDRQAAFDAVLEPLRVAAERTLRTSERDDVRTALQVVASDRPAEALSSYAQEHGFDLLIVGRHGREHASRGHLGRVVGTLAEQSRCPLLLVEDSREGDHERSDRPRHDPRPLSVQRSRSARSEDP
jgi:nucleotide-binding universal stress UspA family protein